VIKRAAAGVNRDLGQLDAKIADAIVHAAREVIEGKHYHQLSQTRSRRSQTSAVVDGQSGESGGLACQENAISPQTTLTDC
jgi:hypothetical protein